MHSETADFYYAWLRLALKDRYSEFKPLYSPSTQEIVVNPKAGKTEEEYVTALTRVFKNCYDPLKDNGILAFTYHHAAESTWAVVLKAVLEGGFYIVDYSGERKARCPDFEIELASIFGADRIDYQDGRIYSPPNIP
jgi:adenine-specific DNA methylase